MTPDTPTRIRNLIPAELLPLALAALASVTIGAIVTKSPVAAIALIILATLIAIAVTRPVQLFAVGMVLLAVESTRIFGAKALIGQPGAYKLALYACTLPLLFDRGINRKKCAPLIAYMVVLLLTESLATPLPGLTTGQTASSLATLSLAWLVFAINWDWRRDHHLLKLLAWVPTLSVLIGAVLDSAGILSLFRSSPPRLEGATYAASLGAISLAAIIACLVLYRRQQWRWAGLLGFVNVVFLGASLSRGAAVALCISSVPLVARFGRRQLSARGPAIIVKVAIAVSVAIVGAAILGAGLMARNENASDYVPGRGVAKHEIASGRLEAWSAAYNQANVNIVFGRGLGAGPLVGKTPGSPAGFTAQHNEYLRMLLEGGVLGGMVLLLTIVTTIASVIRKAPPEVRADLFAAAVAFAVYSFTENTLTEPAIAIGFLLVFGIASSRAGSSSSLVLGDA